LAGGGAGRFTGREHTRKNFQYDRFPEPGRLPAPGISWIDLEGGIGNLFSSLPSLARKFPPDEPSASDGGTDSSLGGTGRFYLMRPHTLACPQKEGVANPPNQTPLISPSGVSIAGKKKSRPVNPGWAGIPASSLKTASVTPFDEGRGAARSSISGILATPEPPFQLGSAGPKRRATSWGHVTIPDVGQPHRLRHHGQQLHKPIPRPDL